MTRWPFALLALTALVGQLGCEEVTHLRKFAVKSDDPAADSAAICRACPSSADELQHPPCPSPSDLPDDGEVYVYAWRTLLTGSNPEGWRGPEADGYFLGIDQDCSDRPDGTPALCKPRQVDSNLVPPWEPLPHGIDNSLAQRILAPLFLLSGGKSMEAGVNEGFETGISSVLTYVADWNGTPNDPDVTVVLSSTTGVTPDNGPPRWDGTDRWIAALVTADPADPRMPISPFRTERAWVTDGVLVADLTHLDPADFFLWNKQAHLEVQLRRPVVMGKLTQEKLVVWVSGSWYLDDALRAVPEMAAFLSACEPTARAVLNSVLPELFRGAADLPVGAETNPDALCGAVSVAWGAEAERALVGGFDPFASALSGCPPQVEPDAGSSDGGP